MANVLAHYLAAIAAGDLTGCIFVFLPVTGTFVVPALVGGPSDIMYGNVISSQFGESYNWPLGAALAIVLLLLLMLLLRLLTAILTPRFRRDRRMSAMSRVLEPFRVGYLTLVYLFLFAPSLVVVVFSFNDSRFSLPIKGFTTSWYQEMLARQPLIDATKNSLLVALMTVLCATTLGGIAGISRAGGAAPVSSRW